VTLCLAASRDLRVVTILALVVPRAVEEQLQVCSGLVLIWCAPLRQSIHPASPHFEMPVELHLALHFPGMSTWLLAAMCLACSKAHGRLYAGLHQGTHQSAILITGDIFSQHLSYFVGFQVLR